MTHKPNKNGADRQMLVPQLPDNLADLPLQEQLNVAVDYCKEVLAFLKASTPIPPHAVKEKERKSRKKKTVHLIYIVDEPDLVPPEDWEYNAVFLDRYTSPGLTPDCDGIMCYPINEFGGELWVAKNFIETAPPIVK